MARTATAQKRAHRSALRKRTDRNAARERARRATARPPRRDVDGPELAFSTRVLGSWSAPGQPFIEATPLSLVGELPLKFLSADEFEERLATPRAPWSAAVSALRLGADELDEVWSRCGRWLGQQPLPEYQLDVWGRLVDASPEEPEVERAMAVLEEWLLIDAPWPGSPGPLVDLARAAEEAGRPGVAAGLRAVAEARLEVFSVVNHGSGGRIGVRQLCLGAAWPDVITVRVPPAAPALPPVGIGIVGRLLPDVGGGYRFSDAWLLFDDPPRSLVVDELMTAPSLLRLWIRERSRTRFLARARAAEQRIRLDAAPLRPGRGIDWRV